jgi:hypothetical protein
MRTEVPLDPVFSRIFDEMSVTGATRKRQDLIKKIQQVTGRKLAVYTASMNHPMASIMQLDAPLFEDCMRVCEGPRGDLMINSPGGDANTAEKILKMCRFRFSEEFNVIVPNYAKSAATMLALGADRILMGYLSELGPVDPQIQIILPTGQTQLIPARAYIRGLENIRDRIARGEPSAVFVPILAQIRPEMIASCEEVKEFSREFLQRWLPRGVLKGSTFNPEIVIEALVGGERYKSHGQVIDYTEARSLLGDRAVQLIDPKSDLWNLVWELYLRSIHHLNSVPDAAKLFETESSSVTMHIKIEMRPPASTLPTPPPRPPQQPPTQPASPTQPEIP